MTYDPLKLSSGLLDDDDVTFQDAVFRTDAEFRDGQVLFLDATLLTSEGDETNQYFACGNGWETDDGQRAIREDQRDINFNKKSRIGELFQGLVTVMGEDAKADKAVRERIKQYPLGPRDAGFWKGLKCHVTSRDRKGGGEVDDYSVLVIDAFHGWEGTTDGAKASGASKAAKKASGATKKATTRAPADAPDPDVPAQEQLDPAMRVKLDALADAADSHEAFMEAAFTDIPEAGSDELIRRVISDGGEGSLWAEAVARYEAQG